MTEPSQYGGQQYGGPPPQQPYGAPGQYGPPPQPGTPPPPAYGPPTQPGAAPPVYGPPAQPGTPPPAYGPPGMPPRRSNGRRIAAFVIILVVVAGIAIVAYTTSKSSPDAAKVGDCVSKTGDNSVKTVSCSDSSATYKVVGKVEHKTQIDLSLNSASICKPFPTAQSAYWRGKVGQEGYILCLAPLR